MNAHMLGGEGDIFVKHLCALYAEAVDMDVAFLFSWETLPIELKQLSLPVFLEGAVIKVIVYWLILRVA